MLTTSSASRLSRRPVWAALGLWAALALGLAVSGALGPLLLRVPPALIIGPLVATCLLLHARWPALREWARTVDLRWVVGYHVVRLAIGLLFLELASRGQVSALLASRAGWGDSAVGVLALPAALLAGRASTSIGARRAVLTWNLFGVLDGALTLATAVSVWFSPARGQLRLLAETPLAVLPTLVVPLILLTHILVFSRLWRGARVA